MQNLEDRNHGWTRLCRRSVGYDDAKEQINTDLFWVFNGSAGHGVAWETVPPAPRGILPLGSS